MTIAPGHETTQRQEIQSRVERVLELVIRAVGATTARVARTGVAGSAEGEGRPGTPPPDRDPGDVAKVASLDVDRAAAYQDRRPGSRADLASTVPTVASRRARDEGDVPGVGTAPGAALVLGQTDCLAARQAGGLLRRAVVGART